MMKARSSLGRNFIEVCKVRSLVNSSLRVRRLLNDPMSSSSSSALVGVTLATSTAGPWRSPTTVAITRCRWSSAVEWRRLCSSIPRALKGTLHIVRAVPCGAVPCVVGACTHVGATSLESYEHIGKYQTSSDVEQLKRDWTPDSMLPKMYKDREIGKPPAFTD